MYLVCCLHTRVCVHLYIFWPVFIDWYAIDCFLLEFVNSKCSIKEAFSLTLMCCLWSLFIIAYFTLHTCNNIFLQIVNFLLFNLTLLLLFFYVIYNHYAMFVLS